MDRRPAAEIGADPLVRVFRETYWPRIERLHRPSQVWLFGSRVTNDWIEDSDLDVLVVGDFREPNWPARHSRFAIDIGLEDAIQCFCYTPEEFERKKLELGFVQDALRYAVQFGP